MHASMLEHRLLLFVCAFATLTSAMNSAYDPLVRVSQITPGLVQHRQITQPLLTIIDNAPLAHLEAQSTSTMPTTASASDPSDAHTVQQLALVLGRKGLQHAAESMRQHRAAVQRSANTAYHSHLSLELLSSVNWLPSWYKHATSQQAHQQVPAATTADWYAEDMYDDIQEEAEFIALQQAKLGQESESMPTTAGTRVPAKSYAAHMPSLKTWQQPPGTAVVTIRKALDHDTSAEPDQQLWFKAQEQIDNPVRAAVTMEQEADSSGKPVISNLQTGAAQQVQMHDYIDLLEPFRSNRHSGVTTQAAGELGVGADIRNDAWQRLTSAQSQARFQAQRQAFQAAAAASIRHQHLDDRDRSNTALSDTSVQDSQTSGRYGPGWSAPQTDTDHADDPKAAMQRAEADFATWLSDVHAQPQHGQHMQPLSTSKANDRSSSKHSQLQHASLGP